MNTAPPVVDKSAWPDGPWQREPDYFSWKDAASGLDCLIVRNHGGALCGYAGVKPPHPLHGHSYSARVPKPADFDTRQIDDRTSILGLFIEGMKSDKDGMVSLELAIDVHGGLTYSAACSGKICHPDDEGQLTMKASRRHGGSVSTARMLATSAQATSACSGKAPIATWITSRPSAPSSRHSSLPGQRTPLRRINRRELSLLGLWPVKTSKPLEWGGGTRRTHNQMESRPCY